jgi:glycosyltransferase involved in cell wall biosynthesis
LSEAKKQCYRYSLTLVGEGPSREKLEKLAASLDIKDQVIFAGFQPKASRLLPQFRVYAHSALLENRPVAILEAMACSLPILAAGTGGIPECFSDGNEGYYWSLSDPIDGAKKLIQLMESPTIYDSMRQASKDRFKTSFSQEVIASQILNFLVV